MSENMMCPDHKDNKKYRDKYDDIFRKKLSNNSRPSVEKYSLPLSMELYSKLYAELSR